MQILGNVNHQNTTKLSRGTTMKCWSSLFDYSAIYLKIAVIISMIKPVNSCTYKYGPNESSRCCYGFAEMNGICEQCPHGYFGVNCTTKCPIFFYGPLCRLECNCSALDCDNVYGCPSTKGMETYTTRHEKASTNDLFINTKSTIQYEASFTSSASTVKIEEKTTQKGLFNDNSSELDTHSITMIITFGTLISLVLILMITREVCTYRCSKLLGLHSMNDASRRMHDVNDIYTEINEVIVIEGFPEDNDNTGSKECVGNGHTPLTEMREDRCEDVYNTVCKEKSLYKSKVKDDGKEEMAPKTFVKFEMKDTSRDKRETVNNGKLYEHAFVDIVQNNNGNNQGPSFDLQNYMKSTTINCFDTDEEDHCSDNLYVNDTTESTYL